METLTETIVSDDPVADEVLKKLVKLPPEEEREKQNTKDRLVVVFQMTHVHCCDEPVTVDARYATQLETAEEPYRRRLKVGKAWQVLDLGWYAEGAVGTVCVRNTGKIPVQIGNPHGPASDWCIPPGGVFFGNPTNPKALHICSPDGDTEVNLTITPR